MKQFTLVVNDGSGTREFPNVTSFVGEDTSGSFGILAGHARMITSLVVGLARFRQEDEVWRYLAMPGAVLYFNDATLTLSARGCLIDEDFTRVSAALEHQLLTEEERLHTMKERLRRMEEQILKRLWDFNRDGR
jgi:F-type H+-transporting ATPase subunit epsilon